MKVHMDLQRYVYCSVNTKLLLTEGQTDKQTEKQTNRQTCRQTDQKTRQLHAKCFNPKCLQAKWKYTIMDLQRYVYCAQRAYKTTVLAEGQTDKWTGKQTDRQTDRQTNREVRQLYAKIFCKLSERAHGFTEVQSNCNVDSKPLFAEGDP
jgi:hypothetical protein